MYVKSLNTSRSGVGVGVLGEAMYAMGGYDGRSCLKTVERYDPLVDVWSLVAPTNITRSFPGMGVLLIQGLAIVQLFFMLQYVDNDQRRSNHCLTDNLETFKMYVAGGASRRCKEKMQ